MDDIAPQEARDALVTVDRAQAKVADEAGLPRWYWWLMAGVWITLGIVGDVGPQWLVISATLGVGAAHSVVATRILDGRRRTTQVQLSHAMVGARTPAIVIAMLVTLVAVTVGAALALHGDGAAHAGIWASVFGASVVGLGGPEILQVLRRWAHA